jgi:hypothetical protein
MATDATGGVIKRKSFLTKKLGAPVRIWVLKRARLPRTGEGRADEEGDEDKKKIHGRKTAWFSEFRKAKNEQCAHGVVMQLVIFEGAFSRLLECPAQA